MPVSKLCCSYSSARSLLTRPFQTRAIEGFGIGSVDVGEEVAMLVAPHSDGAIAAANNGRTLHRHNESGSDWPDKRATRTKLRFGCRGLFLEVGTNKRTCRPGIPPIALRTPIR